MTATITLPARGHITHDLALQCSVDGCPLVYRALGLCEAHYRANKRREAAVAEWKTPPTPPRVAARRRVNVGGIVRWETP